LSGNIVSLNKSCEFKEAFEYRSETIVCYS
jgi:hypothetical protein